ncbi:MAG: inorganic phosphate transporter [Chloroflexota bacterium]|jgi:PiT family inorganic phosphate transporter
MPEALLLLGLVVILAVAFDFINGFHDTANSIATVVATRVLTPRQAILMAASLNFLGAFSGTAVATTVGRDIVDPSAVTQTVIIAALGSAISWNLITWYFGIPSSSSHALIGGIVGGALAFQGSGVLNRVGLEKIVGSLISSPFIGMVFGFILMIGLLWLVFRQSPHAVNVHFRKLQLISSAFMSFSHGSNDAQKTMGIITMALFSYGSISDFHVPTWVMALAATAMAAGTSVGGWRIIKTMGHKIIKLEPIHGFAAETSAAVVIQAASHLGLPVSTTHVISGSIMGVGASKRLSAVRWGVAGNMFVAWILTIPITATMAWLIFEGMMVLQQAL